jgi:hypothetical protein
MNLELPSLREVRLEDLFAPGTGWRAALKRLVTAAFARELGQDETTPMYPGDVEPQSFVVTKDGLRFYFEDEVPFVVGSVHPTVPWAPLRPYLRRSASRSLPTP